MAGVWEENEGEGVHFAMLECGGEKCVAAHSMQILPASVEARNGWAGALRSSSMSLVC